jgi:hypothetical protein
LAYSAFGNAEGCSNGLLATVSFDELLDVHAAAVYPSKLFLPRGLTWAFRLLNWEPLINTTGATDMPRKDTFHGFGTFYALGNKFEVRVEYTQDSDGGIILEAADLIGIFLDNDKVAASLNHDIKLDICDLDAGAIWLFEEIAINDAFMNGPYGEDY